MVFNANFLVHLLNLTTINVIFTTSTTGATSKKVFWNELTWIHFLWRIDQVFAEQQATIYGKTGDPGVWLLFPGPSLMHILLQVDLLWCNLKYKKFKVTSTHTVICLNFTNKTLWHAWHKLKQYKFFRLYRTLKFIRTTLHVYLTPLVSLDDARGPLVIHPLCYGNSVCLSATLVICNYTSESIETVLVSLESPNILIIVSEKVSFVHRGRS